MFRFRRFNVVTLVLLGVVILMLSTSGEDGLDLAWLFAPKIAPEAWEIACYQNKSGNTLEEISSTPVRLNRSFFFVETRCHDNGLSLTPRQACALESAANLNPSMDVYLLIPSPVTVDEQSFSKHVRALFTYTNFKIRHVDMDTYFIGTPLEIWYSKGTLKSSRWPQSHCSDILRYTTLWKYGGIYADLDIVLMKSLEHTRNFAGAESETAIAAGLLSFMRGDRIANMCLQDLRYRFRGYDWGYNGPGVITRVLRRVCGVKSVHDMTPEKCGGFNVMKPYAFYPIPWRQWRDYFTETDSEHVLNKLNGSYAIHVWNKFSSQVNVSVGSNQPYALIAKKYCPKVFSTLDYIF